MELTIISPSSHHLTISTSSHHLRSLTSIGARPTGSYENEVLAVQLLQRSLAGIKERAQPIHKLTVELQKPRGSFNLKFVDGLTHSYRCSELQIWGWNGFSIKFSGTFRMLWRSSKVMEGRSMPCWSTAILTRCLKAQVMMTMSMNREMGCSFIIMREGFFGLQGRIS